MTYRSSSGRQDIAGEMSSSLVDRLLVHPRVTVRCRSEVTRLDGADFLKEISITDRATGTTRAQAVLWPVLLYGTGEAGGWLTPDAAAPG